MKKLLVHLSVVLFFFVSVFLLLGVAYAEKIYLTPNSFTGGNWEWRNPSTGEQIIFEDPSESISYYVSSDGCEISFTQENTIDDPGGFLLTSLHYGNFNPETDFVAKLTFSDFKKEYGVASFTFYVSEIGTMNSWAICIWDRQPEPEYEFFELPSHAHEYHDAPSNFKFGTFVIKKIGPDITIYVEGATKTFPNLNLENSLFIGFILQTHGLSQASVKITDFEVDITSPPPEPTSTFIETSLSSTNRKFDTTCFSDNLNRDWYMQAVAEVSGEITHPVFLNLAPLGLNDNYQLFYIGVSDPWKNLSTRSFYRDSFPHPEVWEDDGVCGKEFYTFSVGNVTRDWEIPAGSIKELPIPQVTISGNLHPKFSWEHVPDADYYSIVFFSLLPDGNPNMMDNVFNTDWVDKTEWMDKTQISYQYKGDLFKDGTAYAIWVRAYQAHPYSDESNPFYEPKYQNAQINRSSYLTKHSAVVPAQIDLLVDNIEVLDLPKGTENSFVSKLESAKNSLENDQENAAINKLEAFINQVEAQRGKKIPEEDADMLIQYATNLINSLQNE